MTTAGKAPPHWGMVIRRGRARGLTPIFALTQRPSESDKTTIGNATTVRCGRMNRAKDRKYIAEEMNISPDTVSKLKPGDYILKNALCDQPEVAINNH